MIVSFQRKAENGISAYIHIRSPRVYRRAVRRPESAPHPPRADAGFGRRAKAWTHPTPRESAHNPYASEKAFDSADAHSPRDEIQSESEKFRGFFAPGSQNNA